MAGGLVFRLALICASLAALAGCFGAGEDEQTAAVHQQCEAGEIACVKPDDQRGIIACQAGDSGECQKLAVRQCDRGDRHVCEALAVERSKLQPLCDSGAAAACRAIDAPWPGGGSWKVDDQIKSAQAECKAGDADACRILSLTVHADGERLFWTENFVEGAAKKSAD